MTYPDKSAIRAEIEQKILNGQIVVPREHLLDSREFVTNLIKGEFKTQRKLWDDSQISERNKFRAELENELMGREILSQFNKDALWDFAWGEGHSGGYEEVRNKYIDLLDFAIIILSDKQL